MDPREFISKEGGAEGGIGYEVSFADMGVTQTSLNKRPGKVGFRTSLTEWLKAARRRARPSNPIAPNQADVVNWVLYDRFQFAPSTTIPNKFQFFTQPIGTNNKTKTDTNMDQVQRLPDPLWFNTTGIGFYFNPNIAPADITSFFATEYMEYWVGQKVYLEGPTQCFPAGAGIWAELAVSGGTATIVSNGQPQTSNVYDVRLPAGIHLGVDSNNVPIVTDGLIGITILQGQQFHVDFQAPSGGAALVASGASPVPGTGLSIMAYLYGILSRGVQ